MNGQVGSLVMDHEGQVVAATGELYGATGKRAAQVVLSMLQVRKPCSFSDYGVSRV